MDMYTAFAPPQCERTRLVGVEDMTTAAIYDPVIAQIRQTRDMVPPEKTSHAEWSMLWIQIFI